MRPTLLLCVFVVLGCIANAQFTILPQAGFENTRTSIGFNELASFAPDGSTLSPQLGIRLDYKNKKGYGPFLGVATSRSIVRFNFSDPQAVMNDYSTSKGNTQIRLEGGLQFSTKPIYFKKGGSANKYANAAIQQNNVRKSCGSMARMGCGSKANKASAPLAAGASEKSSWVRIQPSLGVAYIPFSPTGEIIAKPVSGQTSYEYNAGNWKTAVISGVGFQFGKNEQPVLMLSLNYIRGIGNLDTRSITTVSGNKPTTTTLQSGVSGWNLRMGIPFSLSKPKSVVKQPVIEKTYREQRKCGQYRIHYKPRCSKVI